MTGRRAFGVNNPLPVSVTGALRLPRILRESTSFVLADHNVKTVGLFRINGRTVIVNILREAYDRGQKFIIWKEDDSVLTFSHWKEGHGNVTIEEHQFAEGFSLTSATALIKLWYSELQEPIFPQASYPFLQRTFADSPDCFQTSTIMDLIGESSDWSPLSKVSRRILIMHLLPLLAAVAEHQDWNNMSAYNLAICFAPALLRGQDALEDTNMITTINRILQHAIMNWNSGLAAACGMNKWTFDKSLRVPEAIEDQEDPLDTTVSSTTPQQSQSDGIMLIDNDASDDDEEEEEKEEEEEEERPPLPPRANVSGESEEDRPPLPPRVIIEQFSAEHPDRPSMMQRKPAPVIQSPPRYSTIFTHSPVGTENLPAYTITGNSCQSSLTDPDNSIDNGSQSNAACTVSRKPLPKSSNQT